MLRFVFGHDFLFFFLVVHACFQRCFVFVTWAYLGNVFRFGLTGGRGSETCWPREEAGLWKGSEKRSQCFGI